MPDGGLLAHEPDLWRRYVLESLVETSIAWDVILLTRVDKPALLRRLFELACRYLGQVLSYTKMLGQLQDAGNDSASQILRPRPRRWPPLPPARRFLHPSPGASACPTVVPAASSWASAC